MDRTVKTMLIAGVLSLYCASASAVTVPNKFTANTPAVAAEVNENFSALEEAINNSDGAAVFTQRKIEDNSGVGKSTCLTGEVIVGANCHCSGSPSSGTNLGVLFGCNISNDSAVGGCHAFLGQTTRSTPVAVTAVCVSNPANSKQSTKSSFVDPPSDPTADRIVEQMRQQAARAKEQMAAQE